MTPIVFIPGFMLDRDLWTDVESFLADLGPAIHPHLHEATSIADMAQRTLTSAPERFTLVGFSMGAMSRGRLCALPRGVWAASS